MLKHFAAPGLALALLTQGAFADPAPPPPFTWTGLYGGVNIGYGFGNGDRDPGGSVYAPFTIAAPPPPTLLLAALVAGDPAPAGTVWSINNDLHGVLGGGQVGYNHQFNPWLVVGLEADVQATDVHSQGIGQGVASDALGPHASFATQNKSVDWFGTVRGRIGVAFPGLPNLLVYGTGGLAYGGVVHSFNISDYYASFLGGGALAVLGAGTNYDQTKVGWTAGGGVEWFPLPSNALLSAFSIKLEYLYTDLGATALYGASIGSAPAGGPSFFYRQSSQTRWNTVRLGVNWHFNPFAAAPVLAGF